MTVPVSILVPVYNAEETLRECLDSIVAQTFENFELVLINDGSQDRSQQILDEYSARDPRLRVVSQKNIGQYPTRNIALDLGTGQYLLFVDCDDVVAPDLLEKTYYRAEALQADIMLFGWDYLVSPYQSPDVACWNLADWNSGRYQDTFPMGYGYAWMKLFRRGFITQHRLRFPEQIYSKADVVFHWKSMSLAERIAVIPEPLYHYRVHANSITGRIGRRFIQVVEVMSTIRQELVAMGDPKGLLSAWPRFAMQFISSAYEQLPKEHRAEMAQAIRQFMAELDDTTRALLMDGASAPEEVAAFFRVVQRGDVPAQRNHRSRGPLGSLTRVARHVSPEFTRRLLKKLENSSYTLSRRRASEENLRKTVSELNQVIHQLSIQNRMLRGHDEIDTPGPVRTEED